MAPETSRNCHTCRRCVPARGLIQFWPCFCLVAFVWGVAILHATAQTPESPKSLDLGIIVVPTRRDIDQVVKELQAGMDFSVLAKERSIDATAVNGGYLGNTVPGQLRAELRRAIETRKAGQLSDVVELPTGFAVLKIFSSPPSTTDLNPKRIEDIAAVMIAHYGLEEEAAPVAA